MSSNPIRVDVISERSYSVRDGFEMTRIVKAGGHTLRVRAHRGTVLAYTKGTVERFDGSEWKLVEGPDGHELLDGDNDSTPSYVAWKSLEDECYDWLADVCDMVLDQALAWLP